MFEFCRQLKKKQVHKIFKNLNVTNNTADETRISFKLNSKVRLYNSKENQLSFLVISDKSYNNIFQKALRNIFLIQIKT